MVASVSKYPDLENLAERLQREKIILRLCKNPEQPLHTHRFFEFVYVMEGCAEHVFPEKSTTIEAGDFFIIDYGVAHQYHKIDDSPFCILNCLFLADFIDAAMQKIESFEELVGHYLIKFNYQYLRERPTKTIFHDDGSLHGVINDMINEYGSHQAGYTEIIRSHLIYLLVHMMRQSCAETTLASDHDITRYLLNFIHERSAENCSLHDAAAGMNYSLSYISRCFKRDTGVTFSAYLQKVRIDNSCRLLANTDIPIANIANMVGYTDTKFFHELFRRTMHMTPREFRRLH